MNPYNDTGGYEQHPKKVAMKKEESLDGLHILGHFFATSGTINIYKSGMALKFNVYDKDFSLKDPGAWGW